MAEIIQATILQATPLSRLGDGDTGGGEPSMEASPRWSRKYCKRHWALKEEKHAAHRAILPVLQAEEDERYIAV
ncbi:hypothetical protein COLO4_32245 [Corchorus olitorius]|uniref:Uncharacterized protein n=1 Tax=Corchorus olitorius TaxID=93759 RepID=A0A1R3GZZ8_9ROSI|nr:hypothetical protein COLO4_32245 [Corchorus olitorius]